MKTTTTFSPNRIYSKGKMTVSVISENVRPRTSNKVIQKTKQVNSDLNAVRECLYVLLDGEAHDRKSIFQSGQVNSFSSNAQKTVERRILEGFVSSGPLVKFQGPIPWNKNSKIKLDYYKLKDISVFEKVLDDDDFLCNLIWPSGQYVTYTFKTNGNKNTMKPSTKTDIPTVEKTSTNTIVASFSKETSTEKTLDDYFMKHFDMTAASMLSGFVRITQAAAESQIYTRNTVDELRAEVKEINRKFDLILTELGVKMESK